MSLSSYATLKCTLDERGILEVNLNRPDVRNAFNHEVIHDLYGVFSKEARQVQVRAVILRGEGKVFCAGGDLNWMKKSVEYSFEENLKDTRKLADTFTVINECPKPVIGLIHGAAIGGGVGLVSVCDYAIATEETRFSLSEVRLGIIPACIGPFVINKIGASHARALFVSAERFDAKKAYEIGLVHEVVATKEHLKTKLNDMIHSLLQCGPRAVEASKKLVLELAWPEKRASHENVNEFIARMLAELRVSPEGQEGVRAFLEKRKPNWIQS